MSGLTDAYRAGMEIRSTSGRVTLSFEQGKHHVRLYDSVPDKRVWLTFEKANFRGAQVAYEALEKVAMRRKAKGLGVPDREAGREPGDLQRRSPAMPTVQRAA